MAYDWRGHPLWRRLSPEDKWAAMTIMEADNRSVKDAKNIAHAIFNRSQLHGKPIDKHLEEKPSRRSKYGTYQPLFERNQLARLPSILRSKEFREMRGYVDKVKKGEVNDPTKGATHYLAHANVMRGLERKNPTKYKDWGPRGSNWTGYSDETGDYEGVTLKDGSHSFIIPPESKRIAERKGINLADGWFKDMGPDTLTDIASGKAPLKVAEVDDDPLPPDPPMDIPPPAQASSGQPSIAFGAGLSADEAHAEAAPTENVPEFQGQPTERGLEFEKQGLPGVIMELPTEEPETSATPPDPEPVSEPDAPIALDPVEVEQPESELPEAPMVNYQDPANQEPEVQVSPDDPAYNPEFDPRGRNGTGQPLTREQIAAEREQIFGPEGVEVSWGDAFNASWENTWAGESLEVMWNNTDPKFSTPDPNFKIPDNALDDVDEEDHDLVLNWSRNQYAYEQNKIEAAARKKARQDWANLSTAQTIIAGGSSFIPTLGIAVAAGAPFGAAASVLLPHAGIAATSLAGRTLVAGIDGFFGTGAEAAFATIGRTVKPEDVPFWMMVGGAAGSGFGAGLYGLGKAWHGWRADKVPHAVVDRERAIREASQDGADDVLKQHGITPPKIEDLPEVQKAEIETHGEPMRLRTDDDKSVVVHRDVTDANADAAARLESDAPVIRDAFEKTRTWGKDADKAMDDMGEVFERQAYNLQEKQTVFMVVEKGLSDLNNVFRGKIARAYEDMDEALARYRPGESVVARISLPAGTRVIRGGELGEEIGSKGDIFFGEGALHFSRATRGPLKGDVVPTKIAKSKAFKGDDGSPLGVEVQATRFNPLKKSKGKPQFAKATSKETGERMPDDILREANKDMAVKGFDSDVFKFGGGGAMRANPQKWRLIDTEQAVKEALSAETRIEKEGFELFGKSIPWMISRGQLLMNSDNPMTRVLVPQLMGGLMDMSERMLKKGIVRGRAADEIKTALERVEMANLMTADQKNYAKFKKAYREAGLHKQDKFKFEHERLEYFRTEVTRYRRGLDMGEEADVLPGVKEMSAWLDGFYKKWADRITDPRAQYGGGGEGVHIAGIEKLPTNMGYTPRIWNGTRISAVEARAGKRALNDWIFQSMRDEFIKLDKLQRGDKIEPGKFTEAEIRKIADNMANKIKMTKIGGWHESVEGAMGRADPRSLIAMLRSSDLDTDLIARVEELVKVRTAGKGEGEVAGPRTKYRALLNERYIAHIQDPATERITKVELGDFTENNATSLASEYIRSMSGRVGLANVRVEIPGLPAQVVESFRPDIGKNVKFTIEGTKARVLIDGITSDADIDMVKKMIAQAKVEKHGAEDAQKIIKAFSDEEIFDNYFQMMTNTYPTKTPRTFQFLRMMANFRYLGKAGFPAIAEAVNGIAYGGANAVRRLVSFRRLANGMKTAISRGEHEVITPLHRILRDSMGLGTDIQRMRNAAYMEDPNSNYMSSYGAGFPKLLGQAAFANMEKLQNGIFKWSGLAPATQYTTIRIAEAINDTMLQQAVKYKSFAALPRRLRERWAQNGLGEVQLNRAFELFQSDKVKTSGKGWMQALEDVDLQKLTPEETATFEAVQAAIYRMSTRAIQENKWAALPPGFDHWVVKAAFQLRSFMLGSITQQLVNNSRGVARQVGRVMKEGAQGNFSMQDGAGDAMMGLIHEGGKIFPAMVAGSAMYVLMEMVSNIGEAGTEDFDKRLEYAMRPENLALAGISRSGFGSALPFLFDSTMGQMFGTTFNGFRSSGQTEDIFGNPIMSTGKDIGRGIKGIYDFSQGEGDMRDWMAIGHMGTNLWITDAAWSIVGKHMLELEAGRVNRPKTRLGGLIELEDAGASY